MDPGTPFAAAGVRIGAGFRTAPAQVPAGGYRYCSFNEPQTSPSLPTALQ